MTTKSNRATKAQTHALPSTKHTVDAVMSAVAGANKIGVVVQEAIEACTDKKAFDSWKSIIRDGIKACEATTEVTALALAAFSTACSKRIPEGWKDAKKAPKTGETAKGKASATPSGNAETTLEGWAFPATLDSEKAKAFAAYIENKIKNPSVEFAGYITSLLQSLRGL